MCKPVHVVLAPEGLAPSQILVFLCSSCAPASLPTCKSGATVPYESHESHHGMRGAHPPAIRHRHTTHVARLAASSNQNIWSRFRSRSRMRVRVRVVVWVWVLISQDANVWSVAVGEARPEMLPVGRSVTRQTWEQYLIGVQRHVRVPCSWS